MTGGPFLGRCALITGAAGGIGSAASEVFAEQGASVALVDIDEQGLSAVAARLTAKGLASLAVAGDVGDPQFCAEAVGRALETFGSLDVLFNNAGMMPPGQVADGDVDTFDRVMAVNVRAMFALSAAALPSMRRRGRGAIVNTSSIMSTLTGPGFSAYTTSKAAIIGLTKDIAVTYARDGIRCNAICPGWVDTPMGHRGVDPDEDQAALASARQPIGRMVTPREIAQAAAFLASDEASAITGTCLFVDGGASALL